MPVQDRDQLFARVETDNIASAQADYPFIPREIVMFLRDFLFFMDPYADRHVTG
ncbi:MAG: hypothetical protein WKF34_07325 [Pyrinomonadaceae bacterium]